MAFQISRISDNNDPRIPVALDGCGMESGSVNTIFFDNNDNVMLIATMDNSVCGFLYAYFLERIETDTPMLFLYSIDVFPSFRRSGIGTALINELKTIAKDRNVGKMYVLTDKDNVPAMGLYRKTDGVRGDNDQVLFSF